MDLDKISPKNSLIINTVLTKTLVSVWIPEKFRGFWVSFKRPDVMSHFGGHFRNFGISPNTVLDPFSVHPSKCSVVISQLVPDFPFDVPIVPPFSSPQVFTGWFYPNLGTKNFVAPKSPIGDYTVPELRKLSWHKLGCFSPRTLDIIENGLCFPDLDGIKLRGRRNSPPVMENFPFLEQLVLVYSKCGVWTEVSSKPDIVEPLHIVGEGPGKDPRLIYSCTQTNKFIVNKSISFHNPKMGISISFLGCWYIKIDIAHAYYNFHINQSYKSKFGVCCNN